MKKLLLFSTLSLFTFNVGCSSDDDSKTDQTQESLLIGRWNDYEKGAIVEGRNLNEAEKEKIIKEMDDTTFEYSETITFREDGTGVVLYIDIKKEEEFTYRVKGNVITVKLVENVDNDKVSNVYEIKGDKLSFFIEDRGEFLNKFRALYPEKGLTKVASIHTYKRIQ